MTADSDIIRQISSGNEKAFENLFRQHYAGLCGYAGKYIFESEQAEEIVQDLFFNLWRKRDQINIDTSIESYLFRAVRNACLNYLKHLKIRQKYSSEIKERSNPGIHSTSDPVESLELQNKIDETIESLPPERQKIFKLSRYEGLKYKEIAEKLDISVKTVEVQMGKALKYMRENLAEFLVLLLLFVVEIILLFIGHE